MVSGEGTGAGDGAQAAGSGQNGQGRWRWLLSGEEVGDAMQRTQGSRGERSRGGHRRARNGGSGHGAPDLAGEGAEARRVGAAVALLVAGEADGSGRESAAANEPEAEEAGLATNEVRRRSAGGEAGNGDE